jgi:hypothetical protein
LKKDGGDDNNGDDENEPGEMRGKKKKANRGAPVRVAWYFLHHSSDEKMVRNTKAASSLTKMASLGTPQMQHNGVTLITTSHGLTKTQGAYGLL